jgi:riboflavin synthase
VFTGLVAGTGAVESLERGDDGVRLRVRTGLARELSPGDSIAVNGVCLTAVHSDDQGFSADVMEETLR